MSTAKKQSKSETSQSAEDLIVMGQRVPVRMAMLKVHQLRFYQDNPRVYSLVHEGEGTASQSEIEARLLEMDHVKELIHDIKNHGGLIEPVIVREGTLDVLEGNSRLAAYRHLCSKDPVKWGAIRSIVVPSNLGAAVISSLLSQLHLKGKREWIPYEQAGHIYRRSVRDQVNLEELARETGLSKVRLSNTVEAYQLMIEHGDEQRDRWSYYYEFVKSRIISRARQNHPTLEKVIVKKIRNGEIKTAQELRDQLPVICKAGAKTVNRLLTGKTSFSDAFEEAQEGGADNRALARLNAFRTWVAQHDLQASLYTSRGPIREKLKFEIAKLTKILSTVDRKFQA